MSELTPAALAAQVPGEGPVIIDSIGIGELLGLSWLFPVLATRLQRTRAKLIVRSRGAASAW